MVEWLRAHLEDVKDDLINARPEEFQRLQGQAQAYEKLIKGLTVTPPQQLANLKERK